MQKPILTLALVAGLAGAAQAQHRGQSSSRDVSLGLKAGVAFTTLVGKDTQGFNSMAGFHGGLFANIGINRMVAFQPELLYSQKGAKYNVGKADEGTLHLNYVDVPLAFHVNADGLFFEVGPQVGFLAAAKTKYGTATTDVTNGYNSVDFGYLAGIGYQQKQGLGVGLRYNGGFTNVGKATTVGNTTYQYRARNSALQLYLSYSFQGR